MCTQYVYGAYICVWLIGYKTIPDLPENMKNAQFDPIGATIDQWKQHNKQQKRREQLAGLFIAAPAFAVLIYSIVKHF